MNLLKIEEGNVFKNNKASVYVVIDHILEDNELDFLLDLFYINRSGNILRHESNVRIKKEVMHLWTKVKDAPFNF